MKIVKDVRVGARAAVFAAYTMGTIGRFEVQDRLTGSRESERLIAEAMRRFGGHMTRLFNVHIDAAGLPADGYFPGRDERGLGRIFISNHRSGLDILVTLALLGGKFVSRGDLSKWPVIGTIARKAGMLFVDREDRRSAAAVVQKMIKTVEDGIGIMIFPEGTTYPGDEVRPFKPGAMAVARRTKCEVVPVGIAYGGSNASFEEESFMAHMRRVGSEPRVDVAVTVGKPIRPDTDDTVVLTKRAHDEVQRLVYESRKRAR